MSRYFTEFSEFKKVITRYLVQLLCFLITAQAKFVGNFSCYIYFYKIEMEEIRTISRETKFHLYRLAI